MPRARREQISLAETPYYHCISRCVRRAFLCGFDRHSGRDYEHRRAWIREKLAELVEVFAIDLCAYAIMSNHYHVVLCADVDRAQAWSDDEVLERWCRLFKGPELVRQYRAGEVLSEAEMRYVGDLTATWRERLTDISWFMRTLNEAIARRANEEDDCKGRFWEGRFKSQALLDETAVLTCMAYVDLNPVRAGLAETPEASDYTSVQQRSEGLEQEEQDSRNTESATTLPRLAPLVDATNVDDPHNDAICDIRLLDYLELVDSTGRALRQDKRGAVPENALPVLNRLGIDTEAWLHHMRPRPNYRLKAMGPAEALRGFARAIGQSWLWGLNACSGLYAAR